MTFKNTPSIIRKRASRSTDHANFSGASCSIALNIWSLDEAGFNSTDMNSSDYVRGLSCLRHKPETLDAYKSLGRCLEREFDAKNDSGIVNCGKVFSAYVSSDIELVHNLKVSEGGHSQKSHGVLFILFLC
ncbi:hypothetical protein M0R45_024478 [Rubus argutus]|uniref:Uncharacterized protein n=1 Tax=Rubus argutus TaxID=59490 RepID=A0AAW1WV78_RUBAR